MVFLGNVLWFALGGWLIGTVYFLGAIILFPLFPFLWPLVKYSYWPFGKVPVSRSALADYKQHAGIVEEMTKFDQASRVVRILGNFVWILTFGWILAILHILAAALNILFVWTIVTIPNIAGHLRLIGVAFRPFGRLIVPSSLAEEINVGAAKNKLGI